MLASPPLSSNGRDWGADCVVVVAWRGLPGRGGVLIYSWYTGRYLFKDAEDIKAWMEMIPKK